MPERTVNSYIGQYRTAVDPETTVTAIDETLVCNSESHLDPSIALHLFCEIFELSVCERMWAF